MRADDGNGEQAWIWGLKAAWQFVRPRAAARPEPKVFVQPNLPKR